MEKIPFIYVGETYIIRKRIEKIVYFIAFAVWAIHGGSFNQKLKRCRGT